MFFGLTLVMNSELRCLLTHRVFGSGSEWYCDALKEHPKHFVIMSVFVWRVFIVLTFFQYKLKKQNKPKQSCSKVQVLQVNNYNYIGNMWN